MIDWLANNYMAILVVGGMISIYLITYILNKNTPIPEECLDLVDSVKCGSCKNFACSLKRK